MYITRRLILAFALLAGLAPAFAQAPPPVPALPDAERRTSYSLSASTCACSVGFALYGDSNDVANWLEVWVNGTRIPQAGNWTITSPTGSVTSIPRPITDAVLTFTQAQTGTVQIVGARRPRRTSQFSESRGVAARDLNQVITDLVAMLRENWDKTNDVTGRAVLAPPGETLTVLASAASRASSGACFDASGNLISCVSIPSSTFTAGNGIAITGTSPKTITNNIQGSGPITITGTNPLLIGCPTCNTSPAAATTAVFVASRAAAVTLDLSAYSVVKTGGYYAGGDGGGATFTKVTGPFVDNYMTAITLTHVGGGCVNGTYYGVSTSNISGSLTGHGALVQLTVAGNVVSGVTLTTVGNQYALSDLLQPDFTTTSLTCTDAPQFVTTGVANATCSFTDAAGTKWQLIVDDGNYPNIKQCGAKMDYYRPNGDSGSTDDTTAVQNALYFAANILPPTIDAYGQAGTTLIVPRGISLVGALSIPQGVWFKGVGRHSSGLKMLNTLPNTSNWLTVCDPNSHLSCFGTKITDMTLWHNGTSGANAGTAMVFTNNLQQAEAFARLNMPSGSRSCFNLQFGWGGAAYIGFTDIECGTSTTTNPGMLINYPSAIIPMQGVIVEANPPVVQNGIAVTGGNLDVRDFHCENYQTCIFMNVPVNSGQSRFSQMTGGGTGCVNLLLRQSGSWAGVNVAGMLSGICTNKLNNAGTTTVGSLIGDINVLESETKMTRNVAAPGSSTEKPARPKPISKKVRTAIDAMVRGEVKTITAAAEQAGLSREHLSRELGRPHIAALLQQKVARNLAMSSARAGATKVDLLDSANDMVRDRASSFILGLAGHSPDAAAADHRGGSQRSGWIIDLSEPTQPGLVIVVHEKATPVPADAAGLVIDVTPNTSFEQR